MYDFGIRQAQTGYRVAYRHNEINHCPGCGKSQWHIGRVTAECAFCCTALPLIGGGMTGAGTFFRQGTPDIGESHGRFTINGGTMAA